jgi:hypothetical protein
VSVKSRPVFSKYKNNKSIILENAMSTDSGNENSDESPQDDLPQDEVVGKASLRTKSSRAFGIALIVIVGLGVVALVSIIGDFSGLFQKGSSALNSAAGAEPFFGGLISFLGTLGLLFVAGIVFTVVGIVALIFMAIFGIGLFSATASDKPKGQRTARKIARVFGITVVSVFGLAFVAISIISIMESVGQEQRWLEGLGYGQSEKELSYRSDLNFAHGIFGDGLRSANGPKAAVTSYYLTFGKFPTSFDEAGHQIDTTTFEHGVESIALGERGEITVGFIPSRLFPDYDGSTLNQSLLDAGLAINATHTFTLVPKMTEYGMRWSCVPDANLSKPADSGRFLPFGCGHANDEYWRKQRER